MKTKTIPFDLETAKKIQAGEIKGKIKTQDGKNVRILCADVQNNGYPIVAAAMGSDGETVHLYRIDGSYYFKCVSSNNDLVLEVPADEPQFKPFDCVLVRDNDNEQWKCALFSHVRDCEYRDGEYCASSLWWKQCIPYEGNQELVGTTKNSKDYE